MKPASRIGPVLALLATLTLGGCQALDQAARIYLRATPEGRERLERWDHYAKIAEKLKQYHDAGQLDQREVLEILVEVGVIEPLPGGGLPPSPPPDAPPPRVPSGRWRWPMKAGVVSSEYGVRAGRSHEGLDIAADPREPIYAASSGEVIYAGSGLSGYGKTIILRHDDKTTSLYAHATTLEVEKGSDVSAGVLVATVGSTGRSTGPHLHFEVRVGQAPIDPRDVLPRQPF